MINASSVVFLGEEESQLQVCVIIRESHAVILRDRVVPASQVPFPGEPGKLCPKEMTAWDSFSHQ